MPYNILILGAAYGSLLASKMLFGGHKIHHVCLPAEGRPDQQRGLFASACRSRGARIRCLLDSQKLPGKVTGVGRPRGSIQRTTT